MAVKAWLIQHEPGLAGLSDLVIPAQGDDGLRCCCPCTAARIASSSQAPAELGAMPMSIAPGALDG
jgi:hypothetical protein